MDFLDIMELLNTSSPSMSVNINTTNNDSLYQIPMESNNLDQETGGGGGVDDVTAASVGEGIVEQPPLEETFAPLLPRLELKLPILSSSSSESESEEAVNPTAGTSAETSGERVASPPPNCAICLGRCKNKCFTDSCMHQFCFKCLCEWSKVKPECPLCKQTFKSIIHNVKSIHQFEEYHVQPPPSQFPQMRIFGVVHQNLGRNEAWNDRVHRPLFIYPGSANNGSGSTSVGVTAGGVAAGGSRSAAIGSLRNQYVYRGELLDMYRQEYPDAIASNSTLSQLWRRYVYDRKLYALPVCDITGRFRDSSAQFYRDNPAQVHRLMPWITRDLHCLVRQTQHDVTIVLESINTALTLMNILSPAFRRRLQPYLGNKTAHFIHELNNFARSPYDMIGYDGVVEYSPQSNEDVIIEFTSSDDSTDNDDIDVADDSAMPTASSSSLNAINLTIHNRLTSNVGRGGDGAASTSGNTRSVVQDGVSLVIDLRGDVEEISGSDPAARLNVEEGVTPAQPTNTVAENIELTSGSSDECEFVLERKPPHLRTPEMVSLDSASDSDVVFVDESKPLSKTTFSTSEGEQNDDDGAGRSKRPTTRSKITALVEAKKRSQQSVSNVKNESQGSTEVYNVGASTSAALRLSIQQRSDRSRPGRSKYSLRNTRADAEQNKPKGRGKRLPSESSHSSSSKASLTESTSSNGSHSESDELATSSDEDYVASTIQKQNLNQRKRRRIKKITKSKCNTTSKNDSRKRRKINNDDSSCDEEENGHLGKNFALVMAIGERLKRQKQKLKKSRTTNASDEEDQSEGENSWRLKAVNEPLRKQQQQNAKIKSNERKRRVRKSPQKLNEQAEQPENVHCERTAFLGQTGEDKPHTTCETSSDESESDNLKLIELKTKLTSKCNNQSMEEATIPNRLQKEEQAETTDLNNLSHSGNANETAPSECTDETPPTEEPPTAPNDTSCNNSNMSNMQEDDMHSSSEEGDGICCDNDNISKDNDGEVDNGSEHVDSYHAKVEEQEIDENEYNNETTSLPSPIEQGDNEEQPDDDDEEEGSDTLLTIPTSIHLSHESNVFCGAIMSTTTTDTILNEAAEQISSAAVNFYNPQQAFNTAVFTDDNTSNSSSSSESSVSSTTTTTSSNSSSSNTNDFMDYDIS